MQEILANVKKNSNKRSTGKKETVTFVDMIINQ